MSVLKIITNEKEKSFQFEELQRTLEDENSFQSVKRNPEVHKTKKTMADQVKPLHGVKKIVTPRNIIIYLCCVFIGLYYISPSLNLERVARENVLFEIKAIDSEGHPVAGASIKYNMKTLGVTDSFGEWRRFYKFRLGGNIKLDIVKTISGKKIEVTKNLVVPLHPEKEGDIVVKSTITLGVTPNNSQKVSANTIEKKNDQLSIVDDNPKYDPISFKNQDKKIWFSFGGFTDSPNNNVDMSNLKKNLISDLNKISQNYGLEISKASQLRVELGPVMMKNDNIPRLIKVEARYKGESNKADFLINNLRSSNDMAQLILKNLRNYMPQKYLAVKRDKEWYVKKNPIEYWKIFPGSIFRGENGVPLRTNGKQIGEYYHLETDENFPCSTKLNYCEIERSFFPQDPPNEKWKLFRLKISNSDSAQHVYIGGHRASYLGNNIWQYWGRPGYNVFVTAVKDNFITLRQKLIDIKIDQVPVVSMPLTNIVNG